MALKAKATKQSAPLVDVQRQQSTSTRLFFAGFVFLGIAIGLVMTRNAINEQFLLSLLGLLAMVGVFFLFALLTGFLRFSAYRTDGDIGTAFLNNLPDGICITGDENAVIYANEAYGRLTGVTKPEDVQSPEQLLSRYEDASNSLYRLAKCASQRENGEEEIRLPAGLRPGDAKARWYRVGVQPMRTQGRSQEMNVWRLSDISVERDEQEQYFLELQQAIDHLDRAPVGFFAGDQSGSLRYINATLASWLGIDLAGFMPGSLYLSDLVGMEQAELMATVVPEPGQSKTAVFDVDLRRANGQALPVQLLHSVQPVRGSGQRTTRTIAINRSDLSDTAIGGDSNDVRFRRFFNSTPMAICAVDADGRILRTNVAFSSLFSGLVDSDTISKNIRFDTLLSDDDSERFARAFAAAKNNQANIEPFDATLPGDGTHTPGADDDSRHVRIFVNAVAKLAGIDRGAAEDEDVTEAALVYAMDLTEQKALENQMAQSQKMQAVGQLAGGIAHDFNNVLTAIIMASDLLLTSHRPSDPSFPDIMNIKQNANRAASLVRQLLAFSRRQTLRPEVLSITDVLADLRMLLSRLIGNTIDLTIDHGRDLWPVKADLGQFEQVIVNLSVNARDAMPDGGHLTIRTSNIEAEAVKALPYRGLEPQDYVVIDLQDTGTGIEPDVLKKIFEPFFTTKEVGKGTGLGLSMVYGIIKQTGGHVYADSVVGEGTTFRIFLPRHVMTEVELAAEKPVPAQVSEKKKDLSGNATVLLVEDEDAVRMGSVRALTSRGYTVHEAASGVEAMEIMEEMGDEIDLIVSDVVMPEMDGPSLLREVRSERPDVKFIFVSGYAEEAFAKNLPDGAQFAFLPKPFTLKQLATVVKDTLDSDG